LFCASIFSPSSSANFESIIAKNRSIRKFSTTSIQGEEDEIIGISFVSLLARPTIVTIEPDEYYKGATDRNIGLRVRRILYAENIKAEMIS
jgi:hypothetical protein